jgi:PilZ domain-containing protein
MRYPRHIDCWAFHYLPMRAPRFPLQLTVQCRPLGATAWSAGQTKNISRSGVLIRGTDAFELDVPVELRVKMTQIASGDEPAEIWCRGRVVRAVTQCDGQTVTEYAVAIDHYDLVPFSATFLTG